MLTRPQAMLTLTPPLFPSLSFLSRVSTAHCEPFSCERHALNPYKVWSSSGRQLCCNEGAHGSGRKERQVCCLFPPVRNFGVTSSAPWESRLWLTFQSGEYLTEHVRHFCTCYGVTQQLPFKGSDVTLVPSLHCVPALSLPFSPHFGRFHSPCLKLFG